MKTFAQLGLNRQLQNILLSKGFKEPTEVQEKIIPLAIQKKNIVFTSMTGSGKTLAFSLGSISRINPKLGLQAIILVPTRELCIQVGKELKNICDPLNLTVGMLYGGRDLAGDFKTTSRKNHIIVGTPGRLIQHINKKSIRVGEVKLLVFDESDQMFDNGFYDDCVYLRSRASKNAQVILSSATITSKVQSFMTREMDNYELLRIGTLIPKNIVQEKLYCNIKDKNDILLEFLSGNDSKKTMIFCNTKARVQSVTDFLDHHKLKAKAISSDLEQKERENMLNLFKQGKIPILVATDIAARGLHIKEVDVVINYDVPTREEFYIHRMGRTGRNNKKGYALTLVCPEDEERFDNLEINYGLEVEEAD